MDKKALRVLTVMKDDPSEELLKSSIISFAGESLFRLLVAANYIIFDRTITEDNDTDDAYKITRKGKEAEFQGSANRFAQEVG